MNFSRFLAVFILCVSLCWEITTAAKQRFIRVEVVPDEATVKTVCSKEFKLRLRSQLSSWVGHGAEAQLDKAGHAATVEDVPLEMTYDREQHARKRGLRRPVPQHNKDQQHRTISSACDACTSSTGQCYTLCGTCGDICEKDLFRAGSSSSNQDDEADATHPTRKVIVHCPIAGLCDSCCTLAPGADCKNKCGGCGSLCGASIVSPASTTTNSTIVRALSFQEYDDSASQETTATFTNRFEDDISKEMQQSARTWVTENDKTQCMGDPQLLTVYVTF